MNVLKAPVNVLGAPLKVLAASLSVLVASSMVLGTAVTALAQGRIANARTETRSAAQGVEREMRAAAARSGAVWVGYRVPMVSGTRHMCCYDTISRDNDCCGVCRLDGGGGVTMNT